MARFTGPAGVEARDEVSPSASAAPRFLRPGLPTSELPSVSSLRMSDSSVVARRETGETWSAWTRAAARRASSRSAGVRLLMNQLRGGGGSAVAH